MAINLSDKINQKTSVKDSVQILGDALKEELQGRGLEVLGKQRSRSSMGQVSGALYASHSYVLRKNSGRRILDKLFGKKLLEFEVFYVLGYKPPTATFRVYDPQLLSLAQEIAPHFSEITGGTPTTICEIK